jgi:hypothetical protein
MPTPKSFQDFLMRKELVEKLDGPDGSIITGISKIVSEISSYFEIITLSA